MIAIKAAFVDPKAVLGKAPPVQGFQPSLNLGPSAPHEHEEEDDEPSPGSPPQLGAHYTDTLDEIWPQFDEPEERTAARLQVLFDQVVKEAARMHLASQDFFAGVSFQKISLADRARFQVEFTKYLKRLNEYRARLEQLPRESTDTDSIYVGLVKTRAGAGPVPDAIMHLYFQNQVGVLADHVKEMSEGFVAHVLEGLEDLAAFARESREALEHEAEAAVAHAQRWSVVVGGAIVAAAVAVIGGVVLAFRRPAATRESERRA